MNQIKGKEQPEDKERGNDGDRKGAGALGNTQQEPAGAEAAKAVAPKRGAENPEQKYYECCKNGTKAFLKWIWGTDRQTIATIFVGIVAAWIAYGQNTLVNNQNTLMDTNNKIARSAAASAESSAKAEQATVQLAKEGEKTADATAKALAETSQATKDVAAMSQRSAKASEDNAAASRDSLRLSAIATSHQLRAYISVIGGELRLDASQQKIVATVLLENTGLTPAHQASFTWQIFCTPRVNGIATGRPFIPEDREPVATSFGPRAKFTFQKTWDFKGKVDPKFITQRKWDMWVWGSVLFQDEFTLDKHFTNFSFTQGDQIGVSPYTWELIYTPHGNDSDMPARGMLGELLDPPKSPLDDAMKKMQERQRGIQ